jgi:hypothetical protein
MSDNIIYSYIHEYKTYYRFREGYIKFAEYSIEVYQDRHWGNLVKHTASFFSRVTRSKPTRPSRIVAPKDSVEELLFTCITTECGIGVQPD